MKRNTPLALIRFSAFVVFATLAVVLVPKLIAHPEALMIAPVAAAAATPDQVKKAIYALTPKSLAKFIGSINEFQKSKDFVTVTKDAASVIDGMRKALGLSELDVAKALGLGDGADAITAYDNFVTSGKGMDINADGFTALGKLFKKSVAEIAAAIVASGSEPDADDLGNQPAAPASQTMTTDTPPAPAAKSAQVITIREPIGSTAVTKAGDVVDVVKDKDGIVIKDSKGQPLSLAVMKQQFAGIRSDISVRKDTLDPTDLTEGGTFVPTEAQGIIDLLIADSEILSKVQTFSLPGKKHRVQSHDASNLRAQRLGTGWTNAGRQKGESSFLDFDLKRIDIEFEILEDTIALFSNNVPGLENFIFNMYRQAAMNRIAFLAFNGTGEDAASATVTNTADEAKLVKGFFKLATEQCESGMKLDSSTPTTMHDKLKALVKAQEDTHPEWSTQEQCVFLGKTDMSSYLDELEARLDGTTYLGMTQQQLDNLLIRGHKLQVYNKIASTNFLFARYQNLAFAMLAGSQGGLQVRRYPQPGSVIYRVSMWLDFGLVNAANEIVVSETGL